MDRISFVSFLLYSSQFIFPVPSLLSASQSRGCIHGNKWCGAVILVTHMRGQPPWPPLLRKSSFRAGETCSVFLFVSSRPNPRPALAPKAFLRGLISLLGMSQERWAISLGENIFTDGCSCICMPLCVCVCAHLCAFQFHKNPAQAAGTMCSWVF